MRKNETWPWFLLVAGVLSLAACGKPETPCEAFKKSALYSKPANEFTPAEMEQAMKGLESCEVTAPKPAAPKCPVVSIKILNTEVDDIGWAQVRGIVTTDAPIRYLNLSIVYMKGDEILDVQRLGANWNDLLAGEHIFEGGKKGISNSDWNRTKVRIEDCRL